MVANIQRRIIACTILILFVPLGFYISHLVHEGGHYFFGYIFGKEYILGFDVSFNSFLTGITNVLNSGKGSKIGSVNFYGDIFAYYGNPKGTMIAFGGLLFDLISLFLLVNIARKLPATKIENNTYFLNSSFLGIYAGFSRVVSGWTRDVQYTLFHFGFSTNQIMFSRIILTIIVLYIILSVGFRILKLTNFSDKLPQ